MLSGDRAAQQVLSKRDDELEALRVERRHGRFHRRFVLPDTVDGEKVNATGRNGVLTITIPKQEKSKPRRIQISG
jgi:HSP20 family protein